MTLAVNIAQSGSNNVTFRNKLINGNMVISQRGTSFSAPANGDYTLDRWQYISSQSGKVAITQDTSVYPVGFTSSLKATSSSAYSVGASEKFTIRQCIEGVNVADLAWGTANAKTVTLSAWVYSSLTGTFGGSIYNYGANYFYPFSYTISSANTWTQISVTIAGPTAGTWDTGTVGGTEVSFSLGAGTTVSGTAGTWGSTAYFSATGATSVVGTSGATFYITGVQLEAGTTASPFEYRQYGTELLLCQRYYETTAYPDVTFTSASTRGGVVYVGGNNSSGFNFLVPKRSNSPTVTLYSRSNTSGAVSLVATGADVTGCTASGLNATGFRIIALGSAQTAGVGIESGWTVSSEL